MKTLKRLGSALLVLAMVFSLLPMSVFAEDPVEKPLVINGEPEYGGEGHTGGVLNPGGVKLSKTAVPTDTPNEYEITLTVEGEKVTIPAGAGELVLVVDASGSMDECNVSWHGGLLGHIIVSCTTRYEEAHAASKAFVKSLAEQAPDMKVGLVSFADGATNRSSGLVTLNPTGVNTLNSAISGIGASGGTNMHAGLKMANEMFSDGANVSKTIVVISDGLPTYYLNADGNRAGNGSSSTDACKTATKNYANSIKDDVTIYTIGYTYNDTFLKDVATSADHYLLANSVKEGEANFNATLEQILKQIADEVVELAGGALVDPMGPFVELVVTDDLIAKVTLDEGNRGFSWTPSATINGIYTLTYRVRIDLEKTGFVTDDNGYVDANGITTLSYGNGQSMSVTPPKLLAILPDTPDPTTYSITFEAIGAGFIVVEDNWVKTYTVPDLSDADNFPGFPGTAWVGDVASVGWYFDAAGTKPVTKTDFEGKTINDLLAHFGEETHSLTLYAHFKEEKLTPTYTIEYEIWGPGAFPEGFVTSKNVDLTDTYPALPTLIPAADNANVKFLGWYLNGTLLSDADIADRAAATVDDYEDDFRPFVGGPNPLFVATYVAMFDWVDDPGDAEKLLVGYKYYTNSNWDGGTDDVEKNAPTDDILDPNPWAKDANYLDGKTYTFTEIKVEMTKKQDGSSKAASVSPEVGGAAADEPLEPTYVDCPNADNHLEGSYNVACTHEHVVAGMIEITVDCTCVTDGEADPECERCDDNGKVTEEVESDELVCTGEIPCTDGAIPCPTCEGTGRVIEGGKIGVNPTGHFDPPTENQKTEILLPGDTIAYDDSYNYYVTLIFRRGEEPIAEYPTLTLELVGDGGTLMATYFSGSNSATMTANSTKRIVTSLIPGETLFKLSQTPNSNYTFDGWKFFKIVDGNPVAINASDIAIDNDDYDYKAPLYDDEDEAWFNIVVVGSFTYNDPGDGPGDDPGPGPGPGSDDDGGGTYIGDPAAPTTAAPQAIPDPVVPLADLPFTGAIAGSGFALTTAIAALAGLFTFRKRRI